MRIGAGLYRGNVLKAPKGTVTRPTSGLVRETLFNIMVRKLSGARFLDLFAGCGSVGLEALSRGAAQAMLVEKSRLALDCLRENVRVLGAEQQITILPIPVENALRQLGNAGEQFDVIFLDPPFNDLVSYQTVFRAITATSLLHRDGTLIAQHDARMALPETVGKLTRFRERKLGDNSLSFYCYASEL